MDEVLVYTVQPWLDIYNETYDDNLKFKDIHGWYIHQFVKPIEYDEDNGNQISGCGPKIYELLDVEGFFQSLSPVEGAIEGVETLIRLGHDVVIATATPMTSKFAFNEKVAWIKKHMPFFPLKNFISIQRKDVLDGDVMFDDAPHNLEKFSGISVAMERPWNKSEKNWEISTDSWRAFLLIVNDLQNKNVKRHLTDMVEQRISEQRL